MSLYLLRGFLAVAAVAAAAAVVLVIGMAGGALGLVVNQWIEDDTNCIVHGQLCDADPTRRLARFFQ